MASETKLGGDRDIPSDQRLEAASTGKATREKILDVAQQLFVEQGFDKTSMREIAEQLGITKAAIYYHFTSKDEILMALHRRLHSIGERALEALGSVPFSMDAWAQMIDLTIGEMLANSKIFLLHERNRAAFEKLHSKEHDESHQGLEDQLRRMMTDASVPLEDRLRVGCAIGAVMTGLVFSAEMRDQVPSAELRDLLRSVVGDLLRRDLGKGSDDERST